MQNANFILTKPEILNRLPFNEKLSLNKSNEIYKYTLEQNNIKKCEKLITLYSYLFTTTYAIIII